MAELGSLLTGGNLREGVRVEEDMLDFGFVRNCNDTDLLKHILRRLQSGVDGHFPDLMRATESRIMELLPAKERKRIEGLTRAATVSEIQEAEAELLKWQSDIGDRDKSLKGSLDGREIFVSSAVSSMPVRGQSKASSTSTTRSDRDQSNDTKSQEKPNRISGYDFKAWEKFDADAAVASIDDSEEKAQTELLRAGEQLRSQSMSAAERRDRQHRQLLEKLRTDVSWAQMSETARALKAERERLKGNEYFKSKEFETAYDCYTRSIAFNETATAYSNRAIAAIKLERFEAAIDDCTRSLNLEPKFLKALVRRGTALTFTGQYGKAIDDFNAALELEPTSNEIAKLLEKARLKYRDVEGRDYDKARQAEVPPLPTFSMKEETLPVERLISLEGVLSSLDSSQLICRGTAALQLRETFTRIVITEEDSEDEDEEMAEESIAPAADPYQSLLDGISNLECNGLASEAIEMLRDALQSSQAFDENRVMNLREKLVSLKMNQNDYDGAVGSCNEILDLHPKTVWALVKRAECFRKMVSLSSVCYFSESE